MVRSGMIPLWRVPDAATATTMYRELGMEFWLAQAEANMARFG